MSKIGENFSLKGIAAVTKQGLFDQDKKNMKKSGKNRSIGHYILGL